MKSTTKTMIMSAAALALLCAAPEAQAKEMRARLGHVFATGSPVDDSSHAFAQCVTDETGGELSLTVFPDSQLGGDEALGRDLARGGLEFAFLNPGSLTGLDPLLDIHYLPYIVSSFGEADKVFYNPEGVLQTTLREAMGSHGMHAIGFFELEFRAITNSERAVTSVEDVNGMRLRVPGSISIRSFFEDAGAQAVTLPFPELFVALQQGTVAGQDNGASITFNSRLFEAQKYMTLSNHVYAMGAITVGQRFWDEQSDERKAVIEDCATSATADQIVANRAQSAAYLDGIREGGVEVHELAPEEMAKFVEIGRNVWSRLEETYGADRIAALRAEVDGLND